jgi:GrpB-like predicted nucleotidyltransferase (UPF0157 family)
MEQRSVVEHEGLERRHLLFRDWLRHSDCDRELYGQLKLRLAQQDWPDMNAYADAKGPAHRRDHP